MPKSLSEQTKAQIDLNPLVAETAQAVERTLDAVLPRVEGLHGRVVEAMRYAIFGGGKRLRPFIVLASARLFGVADAHALRVAAAIEALHTYSLVHDDLPCMDDDDLRRGRATTHRKFDEATAVLAGDGLLTFAFELLADPATHPSAEVRVRLAGQLAKAAGALGMVGGQMIDMESANHDFGPDQIIHLQQWKTGALCEFSAVAGPILAERADADIDRLRSFAQDLGLAFQIADDLIDATGDTEAAGKTVGKDAAQGKATLVSIWGVDAARKEARRLADQAAAVLEGYGPAADVLCALPGYLLDRAS